MWNGGLWALGNGLISSTLVIYLAIEAGVPRVGLGIALILAAPRVAGLLRIAAPALIARLGGRKRLCIAAYLASAAVLFGLPWAAAPDAMPSPGMSLAALVLLWCLYHLLEYLGTVGLWSWIADAAPPRIRGRFLGRRERLMVLAQAAAMLGAGLHAWGIRALYPALPRWTAYLIPALLGAGMMLVAVVPLVRMPALERPREDQRGPPTARLTLAPLLDPRFLPFLLFGCWFSFSNGLTQSVQFLYPWVLGATLLAMNGLKTGMRLGQFAVSPTMGRWADRWGNRPVLFGSLAITSGALLFYFLATPEQPWWFAGAWVAWIAYAGLNVCLPNLTLKLAPREENAAYVATFFAAGGICYAAGSVLGGLATDAWRDHDFHLPGGATLDYFHAAFLLGWLARSAGLLLLLRVVENGGVPGAGKVRDASSGPA